MTSRQLSESRAIPTRRVLINDTTQLPHDYCTTPGGTLFSTTPGGTWMLCVHDKFLVESVDAWLPALFVLFPNHHASCSCRRCGLGCRVISIKTKTKHGPAHCAPTPLPDWLVCSAEILVNASHFLKKRKRAWRYETTSES